MLVHQDGSADVRSGVDGRGQPIAIGDLPGEVVICVEHGRPLLEHLHQSVAVLVQADVQHDDLIAGVGLDLLDQGNVPLDQ